MLQVQAPSLQKYLLQLKKNIQVLPAPEQEDLLKELESHFYEELNQGHSPERILADIGEPKAYAGPFLNQYSERVKRTGKLPEHARFMFKRALWPALLGALAYTALMEAQTFELYASQFQKHPTLSKQFLELMICNLPAILTVVLPVLSLILVPTYIYALRGNQSIQTLRSGRVWLMTLLAGLLIAGADFAVQEYLLPRANLQAISVLKDLVKLNAGKPVFFSDTHVDLHTLSTADSYSHLTQVARDPQLDADQYRKDLKAYYSKFALPLGALAFALYGLLTASLLLSGLFHPGYTFGLLGVILPQSLWFVVNNIAFADTTLDPALNAFLPDLALLAVSLPFLLGLILQLPRTRTDNAEAN